MADLGHNGMPAMHNAGGACGGRMMHRVNTSPGGQRMSFTPQQKKQAPPEDEAPASIRQNSVSLYY
jgi:hypothetical protein